MQYKKEAALQGGIGIHGGPLEHRHHGEPCAAAGGDMAKSPLALVIITAAGGGRRGLRLRCRGGNVDMRVAKDPGALRKKTDPRARGARPPRAFLPPSSLLNRHHHCAPARRRVQ